eukprot:CAMPEP_0204589994 /NCGR_PEP_ID=MMETSP0661-20131031/49534_1 /ASSEMBLY_ACC=CAM_ASM_000606 /TAXON_ID=109239 /ORGANISM="Alexandrium margalefi, Strain AMGDE01CS-322" /LENGTH=56 /DNA_ID=CAMNT_0051599979 /DNA_START=34 /DNA_END=201 /DNA_ORIENTATION=-
MRARKSCDRAGPRLYTGTPSSRHSLHLAGEELALKHDLKIWAHASRCAQHRRHESV